MDDDDVLGTSGGGRFGVAEEPEQPPPSSSVSPQPQPQPQPQPPPKQAEQQTPSPSPSPLVTKESQESVSSSHAEEMLPAGRPEQHMQQQSSADEGAPPLLGTLESIEVGKINLLCE